MPPPEIIGGARGGLWNFNALSTDTNTAPVTGRFHTDGGTFGNATRVAIHAITLQGIDRTDTLRTLLVDDIIQAQDALVRASWARYVVQSLPIDKGGWFQFYVALEAIGNVVSRENQEIIILFTANSNAVAIPVYVETMAYMTTTVAMAGALDTKPQQTDGVQLLTASITPKRAANKLRIEATIPFGSVGDGVWFALFQDSTAAAIHAAVVAPAKDTASIANLDVEIPAGKTVATTIKLRFGNLPGKNQVVAVNGNSTARWLGGASRVTLSITEHV